jgi:hypothetical protein
MVLGMDLAGTCDAKVANMMAKQLEDARKMLYTSPGSLNLSALMVDVLKILCEERGISVKRLRKPHKGDLIIIKNVRTRDGQVSHTITGGCLRSHMT